MEFLDETDRQILVLLKQNSRQQWREIGEVVHLTGQAVAKRIKRMEELGVIESFTIRVNPHLEGKTRIGFVTVFMKTLDHASFLQFILNQDMVEETHRISGEGCYLLRVRVKDEQQLSEMLDQLLTYGNYRVNLSIGQVKPSNTI